MSWDKRVWTLARMLNGKDLGGEVVDTGVSVLKE